VCGVVGAAVAASCILGLDEEPASHAAGLALLEASGLLAAFGTDAKSLQVGMAAAGGVRAARLAHAGAATNVEAVRRGYEHAYGATWTEPDPASPAIRENWIKAYPCCLQTHSAIDAAALARAAGVGAGPILVRTHPLSLQAAPYRVPATPLEAKFSIPYTTAFTFLHGPPTVADFSELDHEVLHLAAEVKVDADPGLDQSETVLETADGRSFAVHAAIGSPERPMSDEQLRAKVRSLTSLPIEELVRDEVSAADVLASLPVS
jgi:2-methylcitrate dehydratase PrpD